MKFIQNSLMLFALLLLSLHFTFRTPPTPTANLLTQSVWVSTETWDDFDEDGTFLLDTTACKQDNHWQFNSDSTFMITEDLIKCDSEQTFLDTIRGQWMLENNDTRLKLSFADGIVEFSMKIHAIGLNEVTFHYSGSEDSSDLVVRQRVILHR